MIGDGNKEIGGDGAVSGFIGGNGRMASNPLIDDCSFSEPVLLRIAGREGYSIAAETHAINLKRIHLNLVQVVFGLVCQSE